MESKESSLKELMEDSGRFIQIPVGSLIANHKAKRPEGMTFVDYWKRRRNASLALKARLRYGKKTLLTLDTKTMSVVTDTRIMRDYYVPVERVVYSKSTKNRKPKGMRYGS